jgi:hypothetical protein
MTRTALAATVALMLSAPALAQDSTVSSLTAPRVDRQIKVKLTDKAIRMAIDSRDDYHALETGQLLVTSRTIVISVPELNPLEFQYTVSREEAPDPAHADLVQLITGLLKLPGIFDPNLAADKTLAINRAAFAANAAKSGAGCPALTTASAVLQDLQDNLFPATITAKAMKGHLDAWREAIRKTPGAPGVVDARANIRDLLRTLNTNLQDALAAIERLEKLAPPTLVRPNALGIADAEIAMRRNAEKPAAAPKPASETDKLKAELEALKKQLAALDLRLTAALNDLELEGKNNCEIIAHMLLVSAQLSNPRLRLEQLTGVVKTIDQIHKSLEPYAAADNWIGEREGGPRVNYILYPDLRPNSSVLQKFVVKAVKIAVETTATQVTVTREEAGSGTFSVRAFRRFTAETGAGLVLSDIKRPKYGTTKDAAGKTVVGSAKNEAESYDAAIMANFVCRCGWGDEFTPLVQIGVAPRPSSPSILLGGGFRLFGLGKGDVAIGVGAILAWVKDLTNLKPGDEITGTKDIEADLTYQRRTRPYVALLYKF